MLTEKGGGGAAGAWVLWRNEAGRGGKQNPAKWQIGKPNALKVGLEEKGRKAMMSQGLGVWVWVEIQVWRTTCCLPERCYRKACFQRLNPTDEGSEDKTRRDRRKEGKNGSRRHANRGEDSRSKERQRREEKREGAGEAVKVQSETSSFNSTWHCIG